MPSQTVVRMDPERAFVCEPAKPGEEIEWDRRLTEHRGDNRWLSQHGDRKRPGEAHPDHADALALWPLVPNSTG